MDNITQKLSSRKFLLCLLTQALTGFLLWYGKIDHGAYTTLTLAIVGGYITGNVIQKVQVPK